MAATTREYGSSLPDAADKVGDGYTNFDEFRVDNLQRLELDHQMGGVLTDGAADQDGRHKQVTMKEMASPTAISDAGIVYVKEVSGVSELHYKESANDIQVTKNGVVNSGAGSISLNGTYSEIAVRSGTATGTSVVNISYPTGYTKDNSDILSFSLGAFTMPYFTWGSAGFFEDAAIATYMRFHQFYPISTYVRLTVYDIAPGGVSNWSRHDVAINTTFRIVFGLRV